MVRNKPVAIGYQLDRCDVCGDKYHRRDLVRTQVEFLDMKAENYVTSPSYDSSYWSIDDTTNATSTTIASYGNRCDNVRLSLDDDSNLTYINGVTTFSGSGTIRMTDAVGAFSDSSDLTFSVQVGPHEQNTSPSMVVVLGITNSDGSSKQALRTWNINTMTRVWVNEEVTTLNGYGLGSNSFRFYIQVTNSGYWWFDEAQLEANTNSLPQAAGMPENFVRAHGSLVSNQSESSLVTSRKVCPNCRETVLRKSTKYGVQDEPPVDDPVETWNQEF